MAIISQKAQTCVDFFISPPQKKHRIASLLYLALLFLGGIYLWGVFFNWSRWPVNYHDWADITAPRLTFLKNAITSGQLPLHTATPAMLGDNFTTRFLAIPDIILSPQILLLRFLRINQFTLVQVCLMYALGFLGFLRLRRNLKLSLLTFTATFLLFNFNGHILAHLSVGHITWGGYFLFPWFIILVFELLDSDHGTWLWVSKTSLLLFLILLQGSYHQMIWLLFFIGLLGLFMPRYFWLLFGTSIAAIFLSMVRLLPEVSLLGQIDNAFVTGYPDVASLLGSFGQISLPVKGPINGLTTNIGTWETTIFTGVIGAAFLLYFGLYRVLKDEEKDRNYHWLLLPVLGLFLLTLGQVYYSIQKFLPLPIFTGERVPTRIISLSFAFLLVLAALQLQKWLNSPGTPKLQIGLALVLGLACIHDLAQNFSKWTILSTVEAFRPKFYEPLQWTVANDFGDTFYIRLIVIGLVISIISFIILGLMVWREKRGAAIYNHSILNIDTE